MENLTERIQTLLSHFTSIPSHEMHDKFAYHDDVKVRQDLPHFTEKFVESLNKEFGLNWSTGDVKGFGNLGELVEGVSAHLL